MTKSSGISANNDLHQIYQDILANLGSLYKDSLYVQVELLAYAKAIYSQKLLLQEDLNNRYQPLSMTYNLKDQINKYNLGFLRSSFEQRQMLKLLYSASTIPQNIQNIDATIRILAPTIYGGQPIPSIYVDNLQSAISNQNKVIATADHLGNQQIILQNGNPTNSWFSNGYGGIDGILTNYSSTNPGWSKLSGTSVANVISVSSVQSGDIIYISDTTNITNSGSFLVLYVNGGNIYYDCSCINSTSVSYTFNQKFQLQSTSMDKLRIYLSQFDNTSNIFQYELKKINVYLQQSLPSWISWEFSQTSPFKIQTGISPDYWTSLSPLDGYTRLS
jgi:hypothetical protein